MISGNSDLRRGRGAGRSTTVSSDIALDASAHGSSSRSVRPSSGRSRRLGILALFIGALAASLVPGQVAAQQPPDAPATRDEVFEDLGVNDVPADYVVLVDTSRSMTDSGLYPRVKDSLADFLAALAPDDFLSLRTFDSVARVEWSAPVGDSPQAVLDSLPDSANGTATDIGAGIESGLRDLERPDANPVGAIVLITDGLHQPPDATVYPTTDGAPWEALRARADAVSADHLIRSYAYPLTDQAQAGLLDSVFTNTEVLSQPATQLPSFFDRLKSEVRADKARLLLESDLPVVVRVVWPEQDLADLDLTEGSAEVEIRLRSKAQHTPVTLSRFDLQSTGLPISADGFPDSITLAPGQERSIPLTLSFETRGGFGLGRHVETQSGQLELDADVSSPWQTVIDDDLGIEFEGRLRGNTTEVTATGEVGWGWPSLILLALVISLVVALIVRRWIGRNPRLRGTLTASPPGSPQARVVLSGRVVTMGQQRGSKLKIAGKGSVRGKRVKKPNRRGHDVELLIRYSADGKKQTAKQCKPGGSAAIDGVTFTYRT